MMNNFICFLTVTMAIFQLNPAHSNDVAPVDTIELNSFNQFVARMQIGEYTCTGTYLSETVLLTSRHCIDRIENNSLPNRDNFILRGQVQGDQYEDASVISGGYTLPRGQDMALVVVYPPLEPGTNSFPSIQHVSRDSIARDHSLSLSGYPGSQLGTLVEGCGDAFSFPANDGKDVIRYHITTERGMSGSALRICGNDNTIIGVHNWDGTGWGNVGLLFTEEDVEFINEFIKREKIHPFKNLDWLKLGPNFMAGTCPTP